MPVPSPTLQMGFQRRGQKREGNTRVVVVELVVECAHGERLNITQP